MTISLFRHYVRVPLLLLALFEVAAIASAPLLVGWALSRRPPFAQIAIFVVACNLCLIAMGLYSAGQRARPLGLLVRIAMALALAMAIVVLVSFFAPALLPQRAELLLWGGTAFVLASLGRMVFEKLVPDDIFRRRVLVYGVGSRAASLAALRRRTDLRAFAVVGYIPPTGEAPLVPHEQVISSESDLLVIARREDVDEIVVAMEDRRREFPVRTLLECRLAGIEITDLVDFLERETGKVRLDVLNPSWMIFGEGFKRDPIRRTTKRVCDVAAAVLLLLLTWPIMLVTAIAILLEDGLRSDIFYRQRRVGFEGEVFDVLKFRSMRRDAEPDGRPQWASKADPRVTRVGAVIRKLRIDELPQVINVLKGDMSFVGPRPERPEFVSALGDTIPYYIERHCAKPGITGWAQICYPYGASERDATEKLQYDLYYVKNHSLLFDLMILLQTVEIVLMGKGGR